MFNFLTPKPDTVLHNDPSINQKTVTCLQETKSFLARPLLATFLTATLLLSACQQQTEPAAIDNGEQSTKQTLEQQRSDANKPPPQSDSAAARIAQFQPLYVTQMQGLQRRLQAEYESLEAADAADEDNVSLLTNPASIAPAADLDATVANTSNAHISDTNSDGASDSNAMQADSEINISTEVGERDLKVLKRISLEPREPELLIEEQIIERYQQAMQALYQPAVKALSAQETDTLLNIATLVPELFEHAEIAERVTVKSPALARLIIQHQVWEQIEVQQALDMQQMEVTQQQEFESLMTKFNQTIEGYDKQIADYEQTLKEFSDSAK